MVDNILNGVRWEFVDAAARTVGLLSSLHQQGGSSRDFVEVLLSTFGRGNPGPALSTSEQHQQ
jgi:hypothetical protein